MKVLAKINHVLLFVLGCATGFLKVAGIWMYEKVKFEFALFEQMGFSRNGIILFGIVQVVAALLLLHPRTLRFGVYIALICFITATATLFLDGNIPFGVFSFLFMAMAVFANKQNFFTLRAASKSAE